MDWAILLARWVTTDLGVISLVALALTVITFYVTAEARWVVDNAMADTRSLLGFLDLGKPDADRRLEERRPAVPERLWTYDEAYLVRFARAALECRIYSMKRSALDFYVRRILGCLDIGFAICMGVCASTLDLAIAPMVRSDHPILAGLACLGAGMAVIYMLADVGEDLKLASMLGRALAATDPEVVDVTPAEAREANLLTRFKIVALVASGPGVLIFMVLAIVYGMAFPPSLADYRSLEQQEAERSFPGFSV